MIKLTTYKCDFSECGNETNDIEKAGWLEIGSEDHTLFITNHLKDKHLISLKKYKHIHFCSSKCLSRYFFEEPNQAK
jgi:hypothetical protein